MKMQMMKSERRLPLLCGVALLVCVVFLLASTGAFAASFDSISLKTMDAVTADDVQPVMYFEPEYFGAGFAAFPSNGDQYVPGGGTSSNTSVGRGPHGGYSTTSSKCGVCHAAHSAYSDSEGLGSDRHLLRQGSTGCEYCHLSGSVIDGAGGASNRIVYTGGSGVSDLEKGSGRSGHEISGSEVTIPVSNGHEITLTCASCHMVHGANTGWLPDDFWGSPGQYANSETTAKFGYKLLRSDPLGAGYPALTHASGSYSLATDTEVINQYTMNVWCANCHDKAVVSWPSVESQATTFTAEGTPHETAYASATPEAGALRPDGKHASVLKGIYSGSGQCYSCHRGDLLAPDASTASGVNAVASTAELASFRSLGYYPLAANSLAEQDHNLECSACHFGTADYAFAKALGSDWPHMSNGDVKILGSNDDAGYTVASDACARCHVSDENEAGLLWISQHYIDHTYIFSELIETIGSLEASYSPGYTPTP